MRWINSTIIKITRGTKGVHVFIDYEQASYGFLAIVGISYNRVVNIIDSQEIKI